MDNNHFRKNMLRISMAIIFLITLVPIVNAINVFAQENVVRNGGFENDLEYWETNDSGGAITTPNHNQDWKPADGGNKLLNYWSADGYVADTYQTISGLENGDYVLSAMIANSGVFNEVYLYGVSGSENARRDIPNEGNWTRIEMPVTVEDGEILIGIHADGRANAWLGVDNVTLTKSGNGEGATTPTQPEQEGTPTEGETPTPERDDFIYGVDISTITKVEDYGGEFFDDGVKGDAIDILTSYGANWGRLKIWEDPEDVYPNGKAYNDLDDTIEKAVRIKEADMNFLLNFHYSGFWADPGRQRKPESWNELSFEQLVDAVYDHTVDTIEALVDAGATPDMVQIGNEIRPGMLFPDGRIVDGNFNNLAALLNSGIDAVRDTLGEDVDIMMHLDQGGDNSAYRWWFDGIINAGVTDFQVIGASYYPYWHGTLDDLENNLNDVSQRYERDVVVVETAYAFILADQDGHSNIFTAAEEDIAGYPATVEGQARFLYDVMEVVRNVPNDRGLGIFYWEPAWLGVEGAGWRAGEGNAWENQAMFDFEGNALHSLNVFTKGHVPPVAEPREREEEAIDETLFELTLHSRDKPTSASSSAGFGGGKDNAPENAVEENRHTSWGTDEGIGAWWQVDLEEVVPVERLLIHFWDGVRGFELAISDDGENYTTLPEYTVSNSNTDITLPEGLTTRFMRVTITEATSNWVGFMTFEAYGRDDVSEVEDDQDSNWIDDHAGDDGIPGNEDDDVPNDTGQPEAETPGTVGETPGTPGTTDGTDPGTEGQPSADDEQEAEGDVTPGTEGDVTPGTDDDMTPGTDEDNVLLENEFTDEDEEDDRDDALPNTATNIFSTIMIGLLLLAVGLAIYWFYSRRKRLTEE